MRGKFSYFTRALFSDARAQQPSPRELELVEQIAAKLAKTAKPTRT